jgi:probable phosphoglycerate mutase
MARHFICSADGGSRGNPGPAAYGAVVTENGKILHELYETIGIETNNVAEYSGLLAALRKVNEIDPTATVEVHMDSKLVVEQMSGRWQIKHPGMRILAKDARDAHDPSLVTYKWIPRDQNSHADRLANKALDGDATTMNAPQQKNFLTERLVSGETPTTIYFIRHGETILTPERRFSGAGGSDPELSEIGVAQAKQVALEIAARKPDVLIASPMVRTRQTAEEIQKTTGLDIHFDEAWVECAFGEWDGLTVADVQQLYPNEWLAWVSGTDFAPKGGESYEDVFERISGPIKDLADNYPGKTVVVVAHNVVVKAIACEIMGVPIDTFFHIDVAPCSITTAQIYPSDGLRVLKSLSDRSYIGLTQSHQ